MNNERPASVPTRRVYLNGRLLRADKAAVSVFDRGLNYGDGVFETMKSVNGDVAFLRGHIRRLLNGCRAIGIPENSLKCLTDDIKNGAIEKLLKANSLQKITAYVRITVTRGVDMAGHLPKRGSAPTIIITAKDVDIKAVSFMQRNGIKAVTIRGALPQLPGVKSLNFLPNVLGRAKAKQSGATEGIFVNNASVILEGTSSNIFLVRDGTILTPPLADEKTGGGILPGITREAVLKTAKKNGINGMERTCYQKYFDECSEVFMTNSIIDIVPVVMIDGRKIGDGKPGFLTRLMQELFKDLKKT